MKTEHKARHSGDSCSCTTCVYKSESDHPSLRRIIDLGSRIDRLYYGKYIPLRERKLLSRLVRTRAVYDDIRAQLVSNSTLSFSTKGDYNPGKNKSKELDDTEKSSATVLKLVNMVDRGATGSKKLDDCCSCCSCSSKIKFHEHRHRQPRTYGGAEEYLARRGRLEDTYHRKKGVRFKAKHIRSDPCTCTFKLIKKHSKAIYKKIHQGPPFQHLRTQPDEGIKQNRNRIGDIARTSYKNLIDSNMYLKEKVSDGISKLKESQTRFQEKMELQTKLSIEKINQAKTKIASKVKTGAQKLRDIYRSEWQIGPENELAFQLKKDSISKFKEELRRKQIMKDWECEPECFEELCVPEKCFIKLKQKKVHQSNIHHKGVSYNIKTLERKTGEPSHNSNYKIQAHKLAKAKIIKTNRPTLRAQQTRGIKVSSVSSDVAPKRMKQVEVTGGTYKKGNESGTLKSIPVTAMPKKVSVENVKLRYPVKKAILEDRSSGKKSSQRQVARVGSSFSFNIEFYKDKPRHEIPVVSSRSYTDSKQHPSIDYRYKKPVKEKKTKKKHLRQQGSQIVFKKSLKDVQTGGHALKRCFCTLKLRAKGNKAKIKRPLTKKAMTTESSTLIFNLPATSTLDAQTNTAYRERSKRTRTKSNLLPYECEPGVCIPGQCNPYQCIKFINLREAKRRNSSTQARHTKSTSSFTLRSYKPTKPKNIQSIVTHRVEGSKPRIEKQSGKREKPITNSPRQAVRIGSTFSFNVEFFKDTPNYQYTERALAPRELKSLAIKPRPKETRKLKLKDRGHQGNLRNIYRNTPTQIIKKDRDTTTQIIQKQRNASIGTALKRCFCTLALQRKDIMKNLSTKTLSIATETSELRPIDTANKGTKTKLKYSRSLEPYECEPNTCIPGACNPYICLERINMRKKRQEEPDLHFNRHKALLEPYECEPFTCVPGECDPYVCLEKINIRNRHLKEVGLTTSRSKTISTLSGTSYPKKVLKTTKIQYKPKQKEQKVLTKTKKKIDSKKYNASKYPVGVPRQAVNIGSTFSFNVEFYKSKSPAHEIKKMHYTEKKPISSSYKKSINKGIKMDKFNSQKSINKGIKMNKLNVVQETQMKRPIKHDKGSVVGPLLKRCFCTLNLQKNWKHQYSKKEISPSERLFFQPTKVYTVNRATIRYTQGIAHNKHKIPLTAVRNSAIKNFNRKQLNKTLLGLQNLDNSNACRTNKAWKLRNNKSEIQINNQMIKMSHQSTNHAQHYLQTLEKCIQETFTRSITRNLSSYSYLQKTQLSSLPRYIRRCFYTMNFKVENTGNFLGKRDKESIKRKKEKLLPYECEPGFCIPGECNPYECQRRLFKGFSKKSGTEYSSRSMSSSISQPTFKSKEYKQQTLISRPKRPKIYPVKSEIYQKSPINGQKNVVRVGSSFSFDIEFSKKLYTTHKNAVLPKYSSDTTLAKPAKNLSKMKGTSLTTKNPDSQSQTASIKSVHKGTFAKPSIKRCFCTLKLQKKGRLHKEIKHPSRSMHSQSITPLSKLNKENTVSKGQNTKKSKPLKIKQALLPYECEPYTCVPGQCDPYQCLEKIQRKIYQQDIGLNTILNNTKSISSTNTDALRQKIHRSRAVGAKPKEVSYKANNAKRYLEHSYQKPSREAVRLGSSFSFNIEFFKDNPPYHQPTDMFVQRKSKERRYSSELSPILKKRIDNKYSQNKSNLRNKKSQFKNIARHASTVTNSFIKRCFCTAQFYKSNKPKNKLNPEINEKSHSFLKRCFCVLKKIRPTHNTPCEDNTCEVKLKQTHDKKINTHEIKNKLKLDLYECKPGICVPGKCDPYVCDKIMTKYRNKNSEGTITGYPKTRSISSNSVNTSKSVKTLMQSKEHLSSEHHRQKVRKMNTKVTNNSPNTISWSPDRNVVRIGSQFSFDIEFFKDQPSTKNPKHKPYTHKEQVFKDTIPKKKVKINSMKTVSPSYISQSSQVKKNKVVNRGIGINNFIKRCFCTLKLKENNMYSQKRKKKFVNDDQISKNVNTKSVMTLEKRKLFKNTLLPYECEMNTCIPYYCDPYECANRIQLRHKNKLNREFGVSALSPNRVSAYSITDTNIPKTKSQSVMTKKFNKYVKRTHYIYPDKGKLDEAKQSVRIGSTFSFNIEFFKNKHDGFELQKLPKKDYYRSNRSGNNSRRRQKNNTNQTSHGYKRNYTNETQYDQNSMTESATQFANRAMRTQSTMTAFGSRKRCFCTLSLKRSMIKSPVSIKSVNVSTETDFPRSVIRPVSNLLPYECEPNVCVPGDCNPVQCLERIKRRQRMLLPYECEPNVCIPGECNPVRCFERIKRRQGVLLPYECEPNICIPGECDPMQCLERIKKRDKTHATAIRESYKKTFGTLTEEPQKSISTIIKKRKNAKNKRAQSKHFHNINSEKIHKRKTTKDNDNNRKAVRISSNFNFDIEFFKTHKPIYMNAPELPKQLKTKYHFKNNAANSDFDNKIHRSRALQSSPKRESHGSSMGPFLKRCFCTLKLHNKHNMNKVSIIADKQITKPKQKDTTSENKSTATKKLPMEKYKLSPIECEPFYCMPGECDPYECAKRLAMREKKHKTQYTITQSQTHSQKGVGITQYIMKSQRSQVSLLDEHETASKSNIYRPEIVEVPRFNNMFNKQAVRVGSNISFNIEFYKENLPLMSNNRAYVEHRHDKKPKEDTILKRTRPKHYHRHQNTHITPLRNTGSEYDKFKTENKSVASENILKRCFCTLKLQNIPNKSKQQKLPPPTQHPQNIEVRRLAVHHYPRMKSIEKIIKAKSTATKVNKKKSKKYTNCFVPSLLPEEMTIILPYMPEKFNKTCSKTYFPIENKCNKLRQSPLKNRGKRLTRKRNENQLHYKQTKVIKKPHKSFLTIQNIISWCVRKFVPKSKSNIRNENLLDTSTTKPSNSERQERTKQLISKLEIKKLNQSCPHYLVYQSGGTKQWPPGAPDLNKQKYAKLNKKSNTKQDLSKNKYYVRPCSCSNKYNFNKKQNTKPNLINTENNKKVRFLDTSMAINKPQIDAIAAENRLNSKNKRFASGTKSDRKIQSSENCRPCGKSKITKEEFHKAAGDQLFDKKIVNITRYARSAVEKKMDKIKDKMHCAMNSEEPLFEMQVDSSNYEILNRDEVINNVARLKTKCKPLIEVRVDPNMKKVLNKRAIINDVRNANIKSMENKSFENVMGAIMGVGQRKDKLCPCHHCTCSLKAAKGPKKKKLAQNPCICGSSVCAKRLKNIKTPITRHWKTCVCGSPICDIESAKIKALTSYVENKCLCEQEMEKRKAKLLKKKLEKEKKEREIRLKLYEKSDKQRREERKIEQKRLEKKIDRKAGDAVLLAESILDVGKFGITATVDILRQAVRIARDPKHTIRTLRTLEENPMLIAQFLQSSYHDTGLNATLKRVRLRCLSMRGVIRLRQILESFPITNYLLNIASSDPRRRLLKKKKHPPKRERERLDFNCSLYMGSLRKRPYLSVYDRCPWFYQHFLSLVYAWKQFIDICLFLLAAVVWSPCILCMEICRACMCCFFCTG